MASSTVFVNGRVLTGDRARPRAHAEYASAYPDREWITGGRFNHALNTNGVYDARLLDAVVPDRPVFLMANDYHTAWCSSLALERAGIRADTADPERGEVLRHGDGTPIGTLHESAVDLVEDAAPRPSRQERLDGLADAMQEMAAAGITWAQEAALEPADVAVYLAAAEQGLLTSRVTISRCAPTRPAGARSSTSSARRASRPTATRWWRCGR